MTTTTVELTQPRELAPWPGLQETVRAMLLLGKREIRTAWRTPAYLLPNLLVPIFFYFVMVGSLQEFAKGFGIENWQGFQMPISILFAVQGGSAGLNLVADIESGYFDKLLVTPTNRLSILIGAMGADFVRITLQALLVLVVALATGLDFETGLPGMAVLIVLSSFWGLAYSAVGFAIALKTGNSQATQSIWVLTMPLMFLTTAFAPKEALTGWLRTAATFNPMTYVLDGMRALAMEGWNWSDIGVAMLATGIFGAITISLALLALKTRIK
jgi:ABC-2 type transport system permease protein